MREFGFFGKKAFSLVELSIVLVILGLLTGGILTGQNLIHAAELRKVTTQLDQIRTATMVFKEKYFYLPGDMPNATDFWGAAGDCYADTYGTTSTCNGDGSGKLAAHNTVADTSNVEYEVWHFWKQLANAGLIPGDYNGYSFNTSLCTGNFNTCLQPSVNGMAGPFSGSGWSAFSVATSEKMWQGRATNQDANRLVLSIPANCPNGCWGGESLSAAEAWRIDQKIDDGMPYTGKMVDMSGSIGAFRSPNCATINSNEFGNTPPGTTSLTATYRYDQDAVGNGAGCIPIFDLE